VSKLELVGTPSLPSYLTLVERRYTVHMIAKANPSSKVPTLPPALVRGGRCASPAHPIKMFGQHWYVFQVADHGSDLPSSVTSGSMETLPSQLLCRIQTQQYMKLSDILTLFLGVAEALQSFHQIGFAHGNVDSSNVFCPRNLTPPTEEHAPPAEGQQLLLSGFAVTPFHRNPLFRAPETTQAPDDASIASDLWALGVVFWDITNYGMVPLYDVNRDADNAIVEAEIAFDKVCSGELTLRCPENCPPVVYHDLIAPLLSADPSQRPSIGTIVATIQGLLHA
jgi:serine/threonine protein kinase